jgi:predicted site-specific integrase-resolvase
MVAPAAAAAAPLGLSEIREDVVYTPSEVAAVFRVTKQAVAGWCRRGELQAGRTKGGYYRILGREVLRAWGEMFQAGAVPAAGQSPPADDGDEQARLIERIRNAKKGKPPGR